MSRRAILLAAVLLAVFAIVSLVSPAFLSAGNLRDLLVRSAAAAIVGCGLTLVILTGEIDISVGSHMALLAAILGLLSAPSHAGLPAWGACIGVLGVGIAIGALNGLLVTVGRVPSIIATLAMLGVLRGLTDRLMGGRWITDLPPAVRFLGTGEALGIPICLWTTAAVVAASIVLAQRTCLGVRVYAVGSNPEAAYLAGISAVRIKLAAFTLTGLLVAVATLVAVPRLAVVESGVGIGFELLVVTGVVLGGTSIAGGRGSILGTTVAVLLLQSLSSVLIFLKLGVMATYWERTIQGGCILIAVLADHIARREIRRTSTNTALSARPGVA